MPTEQFPHAVCVFGSSIIILNQYETIADALQKGWLFAIALGVSFIALPLVGSLAGYHLYLVVSNMTTNEDLNEVQGPLPCRLCWFRQPLSLLGEYSLSALIRRGGRCTPRTPTLLPWGA